MKRLYRFHADLGRMGVLYATFVREERDVTDLIGRKAYFGEVLGKHSDITLTITFTIEAKHLTELTDDQDFIAKFEELKCESGRNPFSYLEQ
jgi:hypothetical protein